MVNWQVPESQVSKPLLSNPGTRPLIAACAVAAVATAFSMTPAGDGLGAPQTAQVSFSEDILPLFKWRCGNCHSPGGEGFTASGLDLTSYGGVMRGTRFGPMVIPGDPEGSNLMLIVDWRTSEKLRMPHNKKKLSICDRDAIRAWIRQGAKND